MSPNRRNSRRAAPQRCWWSQRFITVLQGYGLGARMERGRRYARTGQVLELEVGPGVLQASVQGSRRRPYRVRVEAGVPDPSQWAAIEAVFAERIGWVARLLSGDVPDDLEAAFRDAGVALLPRRWSELKAVCSCPDDEVPCKHIAATLYVFAQRLDDDPWQLLAWKGRDRETLMRRMRPPSQGDAGEDILPLWWPRGLRARAGRRFVIPEPLPPDPPEHVLERMGPVPLPEGLRQRLVGLYEQMVATATGPQAEEAPHPARHSTRSALSTGDTKPGR
jgi:hypothetical protein